MAIIINRNPLVERDLINIWRYTFEQWGEAQADHYLDELEAAIIKLSEQPYICRERDEFTPPIRIHHTAHHLVIYQIHDNELLIIRVLHESMDINSQLDED